MNWALAPSSPPAEPGRQRSASGGSTPPEPPPSEFSLFVGDLSPDVGDHMLADAFRAHFPAVLSAKVVTDSPCGRSKGFGFVRFSDEAQCYAALHSMGGSPLGAQGRPVRVSVAQPRRQLPPHSTQHGALPGYYLPMPLCPPGMQGAPPFDAFAGQPYYTGDFGAGSLAAAMAAALPSSSAAGFDCATSESGNTTVFVGGLDPAVSEDELWRHFEAYGAPSRREPPIAQRAHTPAARQATSCTSASPPARTAGASPFPTIHRSIDRSRASHLLLSTASSSS